MRSHEPRQAAGYITDNMRLWPTLLLLITSVCYAQKEPPARAETAKVADPRVGAVLQGLCPGSASLSEGRWQCENCPDQTFDGKNHNQSKWQVSGAVFGHFSQGRNREALLGSDDCEPHTAGSKGVFLLIEDGSRWRVTSYTNGLSVSMCNTFRKRDGLDLLVCQDGFGYSTFAGENLYEVDYSAKAGKMTRNLVSTYITNSCAQGDGSGYVQQASIDSVRVAGNRIVVTTSYVRVPYQNTDGCVSLIVQPLKAQRYIIIFQFNGSHFTLISGARALALLRSE
jgi:hypothetical protein